MVHKPSEKEQEYFIQQEVTRLKTLRLKHQKEEQEAQRKALKDLHFMHCAKCGQRMETTTLSSVEVEICPDCGGIYLDAGELEKITSEQNSGPFRKALSLTRRLWNED